MLSGNLWSVNTHREQMASLDLFLEFVVAVSVNLITNTNIVDFKNLLSVFPKNRNKKQYKTVILNKISAIHHVGYIDTMRIALPSILGYKAPPPLSGLTASTMHRSIIETIPILCVLLISFATILPFQLRAEDQQGTAPERMTIQVGAVDALVEIAATPTSRASGLMHRKSLKADEGMLFIFPQAYILRFWMKNTLIPLDIGFFDQEGLLIGYTTMTTHKATSHTSPGPALYALEMNRGWFQANKVPLGARLRLPQSIEVK